MAIVVATPYIAVPLGVVFVAAGLWVLPKPFRVDFAFHRRYEPRLLLGLFLILLGIVAFLLALSP